MKTARAIKADRPLRDFVAPAYPQGVGRGCNAAQTLAATTTLSLPASFANSRLEAGATRFP
ncbi:MAG: hypothetical protein Q8O37_16795 [Sulfuricellaceae bacterium]|nr:hypothetical protein [Sulfuricellaceae bacterium]